jgi:hypothetical protein
MQDRGIFNTNTARLRTTAIEQFQTILAADEPRTVSYMLENVDTIANRWTTKKNANPDTAAAYRSRAKIALDEFLQYQANPTAFKPKASIKGSNGDAKKSTDDTKPSKKTAKLEEQVTIEPTRAPATAQPYRSYPVSGGDFSYRMPEKGLVVADVQRIAFHLLTMASDFDPVKHTNFFTLARVDK